MNLSSRGYARFLFLSETFMCMWTVFSLLLFVVTLSIQIPPIVFILHFLFVSSVVIGYLMNLLLSSSSAS